MVRSEELVINHCELRDTLLRDHYLKHYVPTNTLTALGQQMTPQQEQEETGPGAL